MKLTAQEEYGLRCLIQVARRSRDTPEGLVSIREVAEAEGLSADYTAKLMRVLRQGGMLQSIRGATGGFGCRRRPKTFDCRKCCACSTLPCMATAICASRTKES